MLKNKKLLIIPAVLVVIIALHFIPIYSKNGFLDQNLGLRTICIGYTDRVMDSYRLIPNGLHGFDHDKKYFTATNGFGVGCTDMPVTLRLYVW